MFLTYIKKRKKHTFMFNVNFVCLVIGDPQGDGRGDGDEGVDSL